MPLFLQHTYHFSSLLSLGPSIIKIFSTHKFTLSYNSSNILITRQVGFKTYILLSEYYVSKQKQTLKTFWSPENAPRFSAATVNRIEKKPKGVIMVAWKSWIVAEKARRCLRTMFFVAAMTASLLASSLPVLITVADVVVPCVIVSSITCLTCHSASEHLRQYSFKTSFIDVPLISLLRSLAIICMETFSFF